MCLWGPVNAVVTFVYLLEGFVFFKLIVTSPWNIVVAQTVFYGVRMLRAAQLEKRLSGQSVWGERLGVEPYLKPSSLLHQLVYHNVQTEVSDGVGGNWRGISTITGDKH